MRHRPASRLAGAAILGLASALGATGFASAQQISAQKPSAQETQAPAKGVPSDATAIPMPPPAPPPRPADLATPAPTDAPRPPERPAELSAPTEAAKAREPELVKPAEGAEIPTPPPRPTELSAPALAITVAPTDDSACRRRLERLGARFEALPAIANGQCGAAKPLKVTALADDLALAPPVTLVCEAAESLARWATEAQVAAQRDLGQPLKGLTIGTSYECRGQNHDPDAKLSEHSFANGVDVMGFTFAARPAVAVLALPEGTPEATFLTAVRGQACGFFRTVLGPGSDAAHANHLHLDERQRSAGHRLCQ